MMLIDPWPAGYSEPCYAPASLHTEGAGVGWSLFEYMLPMTFDDYWHRPEEDWSWNWDDIHEGDTPSIEPESASPLRSMAVEKGETQIKTMTTAMTDSTRAPSSGENASKTPQPQNEDAETAARMPCSPARSLSPTLVPESPTDELLDLPHEDIGGINDLADLVGNGNGDHWSPKAPELPEIFSSPYELEDGLTDLVWPDDQPAKPSEFRGRWQHVKPKPVEETASAPARVPAQAVAPALVECAVDPEVSKRRYVTPKSPRVLVGGSFTPSWRRCCPLTPVPQVSSIKVQAYYQCGPTDSQLEMCELLTRKVPDGHGPWETLTFEPAFMVTDDADELWNLGFFPELEGGWPLNRATGRSVPMKSAYTVVTCRCTKTGFVSQVMVKQESGRYIPNMYDDPSKKPTPEEEKALADALKRKRELELQDELENEAMQGVKYPRQGPLSFRATWDKFWEKDSRKRMKKQDRDAVNGEGFLHKLLYVDGKYMYGPKSL